MKRSARSLFLLLVAAAVGFVIACATAGVDTLPTCTGGTSVCSTFCADLQTDSENCGTCGNECPLAEACVKGSCSAVCPQNDSMCGGDGGKSICVDTQSDNTNCGGCGKTCPSGEACYSGTCSSACANGESSCGDASPYCANLKSDNQNCGGCGTACDSGEVCASGKCASTCDTDQSMCGDAGTSYCANLQTDNANCGTCGIVCSGVLQSCSNGGCGSLCTPTQKICSPDGGAPFCADTLSDNTNCGTCGHACTSPNPVCSGGTCIGQKISALVCGAPSSATWLTDIQTNLQNTGAFSKVDTMSCNSTTPTVAQLQAYQSVLVFSDAAFADATTLGNNLATYVAAGGYAVVATFANTTNIAVGGNWQTLGYNLMTLATQEEPAETAALIILDTTSPLVAGVSKLTASSGYKNTGSATNGGIVVAEWGSGKPLIVRGVKNGLNHVELNFYPPSSTARSDFWVGDGAAIMKNALLYR